MKINDKTKYAVFIMLITTVVSANSATREVEPVSWNEEGLRGDVIVAVSDSDVEVKFGAQSGPPTYTTVSVLAGGGSEEDFSGDYSAAGIVGLTFKIVGDGYKPGTARVELYGESGRKWRNSNIKVVAESGTSIDNYVAFRRDAGWQTTAKGDLDEMWREDLEKVDRIGVKVTQAELPGQSYTIKDFKLLGPLFETKVEVVDKIRSHFNVLSVDQLSPSQLSQDSDNDGMSDLLEIMAGTDTDDASSVFALGMVKPVPGAEVPVGEEEDGVVVTWPCLKWERYTVYRTEDITSGFSPIATGLEAQEDGFMHYRDKNADGKGPYFYKVKKQ